MIYVLYDKPKKLEDMSFLTAAFEKSTRKFILNGAALLSSKCSQCAVQP